MRPIERAMLETCEREIEGALEVLRPLDALGRTSQPGGDLQAILNRDFNAALGVLQAVAPLAADNLNPRLGALTGSIALELTDPSVGLPPNLSCFLASLITAVGFLTNPRRDSRYFPLVIPDLSKFRETRRAPSGYAELATRMRLRSTVSLLTRIWTKDEKRAENVAASRTMHCLTMARAAADALSTSELKEEERKRRLAYQRLRGEPLVLDKNNKDDHRKLKDDRAEAARNKIRWVQNIVDQTAADKSSGALLEQSRRTRRDIDELCRLIRAARGEEPDSGPPPDFGPGGECSSLVSDATDGFKGGPMDTGEARQLAWLATGHLVDAILSGEQTIGDAIKARDSQFSNTPERLVYWGTIATAVGEIHQEIQDNYDEIPAGEQQLAARIATLVEAVSGHVAHLKAQAASNEPPFAPAPAAEPLPTYIEHSTTPDQLRDSRLLRRIGRRIRAVFQEPVVRLSGLVASAILLLMLLPYLNVARIAPGTCGQDDPLTIDVGVVGSPDTFASDAAPIVDAAPEDAQVADARLIDATPIVDAAIADAQVADAAVRDAAVPDAEPIAKPPPGPLSIELDLRNGAKVDHTAFIDGRLIGDLGDRALVVTVEPIRRAGSRVFWVQQPVRLADDGSFTSVAYFGEASQRGLSFRYCVAAATETFGEGDRLRRPPGKALQCVTVRRR